ncbi:Uma2 family endonuclease [soil metagenome]
MALAATMSPAEFLAREREAETRHELLKGTVMEMPGGSANHSTIKINMVSIFRNQARPKGFSVFNSDLRVRIPDDGYVYPDASLSRNPAFEDAQTDVLLNPFLVVEVLSPSTERHDRKAKFDAYSLIPTLEEYVLVSSDERRVEVFRRWDELWLYTAYRESESVPLTDGQIRFDFDELYEGVL